MTEKIQLERLPKPLEKSEMDVLESACLQPGTYMDTAFGDLYFACANDLINAATTGRGTFTDRYSMASRIEQAKPLYGEIYQTDNDSDIALLLQLDMSAFSSFGEMLIEVNQQNVVHNEGLYEVYKNRGQELIGPHPEADFDIRGRFFHPSVEYFERNIYPDEQPMTANRFIEGMKRQMIVLGSAMFIPGAFGASREPQRIDYQTTRFNRLADELALASHEVKLAYRILCKSRPADASAYLLAAISSPQLTDRLRDIDGRFMAEIFGGEDVIEYTVQEAFLQLVRNNGGRAQAAWNGFVDNFDGDLLEALAPTADREKIVRRMRLDNLLNPNQVQRVLDESLLPYFDEKTFAEECAEKLSEILENGLEMRRIFASRPLSFHAGELEQELGIDLNSRHLWYGEEPVARLIGVVADNPFLDESLSARAVQLRDLSEKYNPKSKALLEEYTKIANDDCFRIYTHGFTGSDEEEQWLDQRRQKRSALQSRLNEIKRKLSATINS